MLFSPNQLLLCKLFAFYPDRAFYMQEIGRILGKKPGVFQRMLNILDKEGFVKSEFKANARFFQLNPEYPILKEIQSILKKTSPENPFKEKMNEQSAKKKSRGERQKKTRPGTPVPSSPSSQLSSQPSSHLGETKQTPENPVPKLATRLSDLREETLLTRLKPEPPEAAENKPEASPETSSRKVGQKRQLELF